MKGVRRNAAVNVIGNVVPMLAAVVSMPLLLNGLGASRMGIFTLALGLFGFAGIFDLGLGRALTRSVAYYAGLGTPPARMAPLLRTGLVVVLGLGVAWGAVLWLTSGWLSAHVLVLNPGLLHETHVGLMLLAVLIPVSLLSSSLVGILEGLQLFWQSNAIRLPLGVVTYLVPAGVAQWFPNLEAVIGAMAIVRIVGMLVLLATVANKIPLLAARDDHPLSSAPMWRYTGWLTVSNIVGPLMVYGDRYYLATVLPSAAVGFYTIPLDTLYRATSLPSAALNAAFPALTRAHTHPENAEGFLAEANRFMFFAWLVPMVVVGILLPDALRLWLGAIHAEQMLGTSRFILAGVLVNGFALVPFTLLQAIGRTDITAKLHVIELPLFVLALTTLVSAFGVVGASAAWALRVAFDEICLVVVARRLFPASSGQFARLGLSGALGAAAIIGSALIPSTPMRVSLAVLALTFAAIELHRRGGFSWLLSFVQSYR